jgi:hypothetical protein
VGVHDLGVPKSAIDRNHVSPRRRHELAMFVAERMRALNLARHTMLTRAGMSDATLRNMLDEVDKEYRTQTLFRVAEALEVDQAAFVQWVREESDIDAASLLPVLEQMHPEVQRIAEALRVLSPEDRRLVDQLVTRLSESD